MIDDRHAGRSPPGTARSGQNARHVRAGRPAFQGQLQRLGHQIHDGGRRRRRARGGRPGRPQAVRPSRTGGQTYRCPPASRSGNPSRSWMLVGDNRGCGSMPQDRSLWAARWRVELARRCRRPSQVFVLGVGASACGDRRRPRPPGRPPAADDGGAAAQSERSSEHERRRRFPAAAAGRGFRVGDRRGHAAARRSSWASSRCWSSRTSPCCSARPEPHGDLVRARPRGRRPRRAHRRRADRPPPGRRSAPVLQEALAAHDPLDRHHGQPQARGPARRGPSMHSACRTMRSPGCTARSA